MKKSLTAIILSIALNANAQRAIKVLDTDFSKGCLCHKQTLEISDISKFHGHLCDGLIVGYLGLGETLLRIFPDSVVDRTTLRIVSKSSPCLTDVAIYLTGARYQFNSFYVSDSINYLMIVGVSDTGSFYGFKLKTGIKPKAIDSLGNLAVQGRLDACGIENLRKMELAFSDFLLSKSPNDIFVIEKLEAYNWNPIFANSFIKTDILNKSLGKCVE